MGAVHEGNWNFCRYESKRTKCFIVLGGADLPGKGPSPIYSVTVEGDRGREVLQKDFPTLGEACGFINRRYAHWSFVDGSASGGGCAACHAH